MSTDADTLAREILQTLAAEALLPGGSYLTAVQVLRLGRSRELIRALLAPLLEEQERLRNLWREAQQANRTLMGCHDVDRKRAEAAEAEVAKLREQNRLLSTQYSILEESQDEQRDTGAALMAKQIRTAIEQRAGQFISGDANWILDLVAKLREERDAAKAAAMLLHSASGVSIDFTELVERVSAEARKPLEAKVRELERSIDLQCEEIAGLQMDLAHEEALRIEAEGERDEWRGMEIQRTDELRSACMDLWHEEALRTVAEKEREEGRRQAIKAFGVTAHMLAERAQVQIPEDYPCNQMGVVVDTLIKERDEARATKDMHKERSQEAWALVQKWKQYFQTEQAKAERLERALQAVAFMSQEARCNYCGRPGRKHHNGCLVGEALSEQPPQEELPKKAEE